MEPSGKKKTGNLRFPGSLVLLRTLGTRVSFTRNSKGELVNRCESIGHYGSSNVDNEECWLMSLKARALGLVYIDHQARV